MTLRTGILALALVLTLGGAAQAQEWRTVTARDGSFTVEMPAEPEYTTTPVKTVGGKDYIRHNYVGELGGRAFVLQTATYPDDVDLSNPKSNLQSGLDSAAGQMDGGKWTDVKWGTYQDVATTDAVGTRAPFQVRNFAVIKGRTIYTLTYAGPPGTAQLADVDRFIKSLVVKQ